MAFDPDLFEQVQARRRQAMAEEALGPSAGFDASFLEQQLAPAEFEAVQAQLDQEAASRMLADATDAVTPTVGPQAQSYPQAQASDFVRALPTHPAGTATLPVDPENEPFLRSDPEVFAAIAAQEEAAAEEVANRPLVTGRPVPGAERSSPTARTNELGMFEPSLPGLGGTSSRTRFVGIGPQNNLVFEVPEIGQVDLGPNSASSPEAATAGALHLLNASRAGEDGRSVTGTALDRAGVLAIADQIPYIFQGNTAAPTGPAGPRMQETIGTELSIPGQVSPETQLGLALTTAMLPTAQAGAEQAALDVFRGQEQMSAEMAEQQRAAAEEQQRQAQELSGRLMGMQRRLQERIDAVSSMRIDQTEAFGGMGGRVAAGIAIALGQIGSAIGGGENAALAIVNRIVDRNMQAQAMNIANERAGVSAAGNALAQTRAILGDEQAARDAARAMHLQAFATQLDGQMAGLRGDALVRAQRLRSLLQQQADLAARAAAEREAGRMQVEFETEVRGTPEMVAQQRNAVLQQQAALTGRGPAQPAAAQPQRAAGTGRSRAGGRVSMSGGNASRVQSGAMSVEQALAARGSIREALDETADVVFPHARLLRNADGEIDSVAQDTWNSLEEAERRHMRDLVASVTAVNRLAPRIIAANREFGAEISNANEAVARARAAATLIRQMVRHAASGAAVNEAEMEEYLRLIPEPNSVEPGNLTGMWDRIQAGWNGFTTSYTDLIRSQLATRGIEPDGDFVPPEQIEALNAAVQRTRMSEWADQQRADAEEQREADESPLGFLPGPAREVLEFGGGVISGDFARDLARRVRGE